LKTKLKKEGGIKLKRWKMNSVVDVAKCNETIDIVPTSAFWFCL
jgi:hypothetical protein